jgi:cell division protein FtsI/penicillin-binding protein 2
VAVVAVAVAVASRGPSDAVTTARAFTAAWERSDYGAMHSLLTPDAKRRYGLPRFERAYRDAAATATATGLTAGKARDASGGAAVAVTVRTRVFGRIPARLEVPVNGTRVDWSPRLAFPGLRKGELLTRRSEPPARASILARDGRTIASGPAGARIPAAAAAGIAGTMGKANAGPEADALYARGFPRTVEVGRGGLERILDARVAGTPGGTLLAGTRTLGRAAPRPARAVRTTIDLRIQAAAETALAGRLGGIAALDARTAEVRALAGIAFSAPQPPGSTFKIVTLAAALQNRVAKPSTPFPVSSYALLDGVKLQNANGESCGGSVAEGFVQSCNSVYAPLGVKVGARRLVAMAERMGWNRRPSLTGALPSTIPAAAAIKSPLELGSTAIGQGKVLATPLQMAMVAQAIASKGASRTPTVTHGAAAAPRRVIDAHTARTIAKLMVAVVARGTGTSAALGSGQVAGKTGTAELESTTGPTADAQNADQQSQQSHTDAWFTSFAPAKHPRIVVAVMLVRAGAGGETAAPAARTVLQAALSQ